MKPAARAALAVPLCLSLLDAQAQQPPAEVSRAHEVPALAVEKYSLPNGLTVLLHQDRKTPVVAVHLWYRVGSKDEKAGRTGFAHLFEHLMFQGSRHHDRDYFEPLEKLGAEINGNTTEDRTVYFESVPGNATELALWMEADRMGFLVPAMTRAKLDNQRDVVKNERRESVENVPYGMAEEALRQALYPEGHPYRHEVIGSMADLSAASLDDVSAFFRTYYAPNNAILSVAGDFDRDLVAGWIEKYFGPIPAGPAIARPQPWVPKLDGPKHVTQTDRVSLPRTQLVWPTVPSLHPDEPALDVLATILGGLDKENRLYRALMHDRRLAADVSAQHPTLNLAGTFEVDLLAPPGGDLDEVVKAARAEIERLKRDGPTLDEVVKSRNGRESGLILGLQSVLTKAETFSLYESVAGDPTGYRGELDRLFAVTPEDVKRVANRYLTDAVIRLDVIPGPPPERLPDPEAPVTPPSPFEPTQQAAEADAAGPPAVGPQLEFAPPSFVRRTLSNGLPVWVVPRRELPIVSVRLVVGSGETAAPGGKEGLASLAVGLLDAGTKTRTAVQLAGELSEMGADLGLTCGMESSTATITTLLRHLDRALDVYADTLLNSTFPQDEVDRRKLLRLADLESRRDSADEVAEEAFRAILFGPEHPYGRPSLGTMASVESITREDAAAFVEAHFTPKAGTLIVVGDVEPDEIAAKLEARFGTWPARPTPAKIVPQAPKPPEAGSTYLVDKPDAAQSVLAIGRIGVERTSPEVPALGVLNAIVGGQFASRLNMNLREDKGYSYGIGSEFRSLRGPGWFEVRGSVQTAATRESVQEVRRELAEATGDRPLTDEEVDSAKQRAVYGFPGRFETTFDVADQLSVIAAYGLPDDYLATYIRRIEAVDRGELQRLAESFLKPKAMTTLVVGDRATVGPELEKLGPVRHVDEDGKPVDPE